MHKTKINTALTLIFVLGIAVVLSTAGIGLTQQQLAFPTTQGNQPDRVTICHNPEVDEDGAVIPGTGETITLPERAAERHIAHGDSVGPCEEEPPEPDTTPPTLTVPEDKTVQAEAGADTAVVTFPVTAEDNVDGTATLEEDDTLTQDNVGGDIAISCDPPSGFEFPIGITRVECTGTDAAGNTATPASFTVTVNSPPDTTPPALTVPADITVRGAASGAVVTFPVTAEDNVDGTATLEEDNTLTQDNVGGSITISCNPPSGSTFPPGSTDVNCTATDAAGNTVTPASFTVTVQIICLNAPATIIGTNGNDDLTGTAGDDVIAGLGGDDIIEGLGLNDLICGNEGIDTMQGGDGNDILFGGADDDSMNGGAGNDWMEGDAGDDDMNGGADRDEMKGLEGSDRMDGGDGPDFIMFGGAGPDLMFGGAGDDIMQGGDGDDVMEGGDGSDGLKGDSGSDIMNGAPGPDHLNGVDGVINNDRLDGGLDRDNCNSDPDPKENCELDA
jgi:Ca2+-binding RTX toxin-like protein